MEQLDPMDQIALIVIECMGPAGTLRAGIGVALNRPMAQREWRISLRRKVGCDEAWKRPYVPRKIVMKTENDSSANDNRPNDVGGNPLVPVDELLECAELLSAIELKSTDFDELAIRQELHQLNRKFLESISGNENELIAARNSTPYKSDHCDNEEPTAADEEISAKWNRMREDGSLELLMGIYGKDEEEDPRFPVLVSLTSQLASLVRTTQRRIIEFLLVTFPGGILSERAQFAIYQTGWPIPRSTQEEFVAELAKEMDLDEELKVYKVTGNLRQILKKFSTREQESLLVTKLFPKVNWTEQAIDFISDEQLDTGDTFGFSPENRIQRYREMLLEYRRLLIQIFPRIVVAELLESDQKIVQSATGLKEEINKFIRADQDKLRFEQGDIESLIRAVGLKPDGGTFRTLESHAYTSETTRKTVQPILDELKASHSAGLNSATVFLCGTVVENILMELVELNRDAVDEYVAERQIDFSQTNPYIEMNDVRTWRFSELLKVIKPFLFASRPEYYQMLDAFRNVRNYIHGGKDPIEKMHADLAMSSVAVCTKLLESPLTR